MTRPVLAILALLPLVTAARAEPARYEIDPSHTFVSFTVGHVGFSQVLGVFGEVSGGFVWDDETREVSQVEITVATDSVNTFDAARDEHLLQDDFLAVADHPAMTFAAEGGEAASETEGTVAGELTMLGQTHPLVLDVTLNKAAEYPFGHGRFTLGLSAQGVLNRSDWGMTYGVADGLVADEVQITISTEALRKE